MNRIELQNVSYVYPNCAQPAVTKLNLTVKAGELKLITGASGCGKTTLMRLVNGLAPQIMGGTVSGRILIDGLDASTTPIALMSEHIGTLFQDPEEQFFALNVRDEIAFALKSRGVPLEEVDKRVEAAADQLNITHLLDQDIHALSEGQKQKVGLASILALGPKALILDEPTANLDPQATQELAQLLGQLKAQSVAILVVDHRLYWLQDLADEVCVMAKGQIVQRGPYGILQDASLRQTFGLRQATIDDPRVRLPRVPIWNEQTTPATLGQTPHALTVHNLFFAYPDKKPIFNKVSFEVPAGITALIGDNGMGKTTLARILTGFEKASGDYLVDGVAVGRDGLMPLAGLVLQNADHQLQMRTVREEVEMAIQASLCAKASREGLSLWARLKAEKLMPEHYEKAQTLLETLHLTHVADRHPQSLSGGEKQRVVIACALAKEPSILILDEPTSGLDGANMEAISSLLKTLSNEGKTIFLITHDLELLDVCDRAFDMHVAKAASEKNLPT